MRPAGVTNYVACKFAKLEPYLRDITPYLDQYGYWAVLLGVFLEDFGVPVPGETLLIAGAFFAAIGNFKVGWVVLLGFLGAVAGDNIGFMAGYFGGHRLAEKYGRYVFLNADRLNRLETYFSRHGGKIIVAARFIEGLRQFNGFIAGTGRMRWPRFLLFNALGAAIWVCFWVGITYYLGDRLVIIFTRFKMFEVWLLAALAAVVLLYIMYRLIGRHRRDRSF